jgi:NAD(P)-dependent dehydrogenase (short-subunit alcohol dehydrogenase family)
MKVLITGTSRGIGKAAAVYFLEKGHTVIGIDRHEKTIEHPLYSHYVCDIRNTEMLPDVCGVEILVNNAGTQNENDIDTKLKALIKVTEKYALQPQIRSVLNIGSACAHTGSEFPEYCASKGGVLAYTKNVAIRIAQYGATCNSIDPGGVITELNECVINSAELWNKVMDETPLKRWATPEEIAEWIYFMTVTNRFCTGQNIIVDGGESINFHFIWKEQ